MVRILVRAFLLLWCVQIAVPVLALERHIHAGAGGSSPQELPLLVAKDLGFFEKYGLDVDLVVIGGGSRLMQALIGRSLHSANVAAMAPVRANLSGADVVITGAFLNKNLYKFVTRKEIRTPADLRGKKLGVVNFGGANEFSILMALKSWGLPPDSVKLVPAGDSMSRLAALEVSGGLDGTVVPYSNAAFAAQHGLNILGDLAEIVKEFPDRTFIAERSFLAKNRDNAKRFFRAVSEAIFRMRNQPQLREKIVASIVKRLRLDVKSAEEAYDGYHKVFSFPPRIGRKGLQDVIEIIQREPGRSSADTADLNRFLDESILDELDSEGFFKRLETELARK
jgi:ABC-type nitrate/sulfonate/bicarbonate transport system substrate-binding protein